MEKQTMVINEELKNFLRLNKNIERVYFLKNGSWVLNAYPAEDGSGELFSRIVPYTMAGAAAGLGILDLSEEFRIVGMVSRDEVFVEKIVSADAPVPDEVAPFVEADPGPIAGMDVHAIEDGVSEKIISPEEDHISDTQKSSSNG